MRPNPRHAIGQPAAAGAALGGRPAAQPRAAAGRRSHPLLRGFPLAVMTLATFLVVFALMMARLTAGADPALHASSSGTVVSTRLPSGAVVRTRTSGAAAQGAASTQAVAAEGPSASEAAVVTRTSGARAGSDD